MQASRLRTRPFRFPHLLGDGDLLCMWMCMGPAQGGVSHRIGTTNTMIPRTITQRSKDSTTQQAETICTPLHPYTKHPTKRNDTKIQDPLQTCYFIHTYTHTTTPQTTHQVLRPREDVVGGERHLGGGPARYARHGACCGLWLLLGWCHHPSSQWVVVLG